APTLPTAPTIPPLPRATLSSLPAMPTLPEATLPLMTGYHFANITDSATNFAKAHIVTFAKCLNPQPCPPIPMVTLPHSPAIALPIIATTIPVFPFLSPPPSTNHHQSLNATSSSSFFSLEDV
ncbi:hypothetical protein RJ640_008958, partial [Escallonia rubra]